MNTQESDRLASRIKENGEHLVLSMRREENGARFRYLVAVSNTSPATYSVYVEYQDASRHTVGAIPRFSNDRDTAESFCSMLERFGITPLSLDAIYEDAYTP